MRGVVLAVFILTSLGGISAATPLRVEVRGPGSSMGRRSMYEMKRVDGGKEHVSQYDVDRAMQRANRTLTTEGKHVTFVPKRTLAQALKGMPRVGDIANISHEYDETHFGKLNVVVVDKHGHSEPAHLTLYPPSDGRPTPGFIERAR